MHRALIGSGLLVAVLISTSGCATRAETGAFVESTSTTPPAAVAPSNTQNRPAAEPMPRTSAGVFAAPLDVPEPNGAQTAPWSMTSAPAYTVPVTPASTSLTKSDVISWTRRGISDEVIIDRIERGNRVFHLTAADENELRDARVSDDVIRAMNDTGRRSF